MPRTADEKKRANAVSSKISRKRKKGQFGELLNQLAAYKRRLYETEQTRDCILRVLYASLHSGGSTAPLSAVGVLAKSNDITTAGIDPSLPDNEVETCHSEHVDVQPLTEQSSACPSISSDREGTLSPSSTETVVDREVVDPGSAAPYADQTILFNRSAPTSTQTEPVIPTVAVAEPEPQLEQWGLETVSVPLQDGQREETVQTTERPSSGQWVEGPTQPSQQELSIEQEPEVSSCEWFANEKPFWLQEPVSNHTAIHTSQKPVPMGTPPTTPHQLHYFQLDLFDTPSLPVGPVLPSGVSVAMAYGSRDN